MPQRDIPEPTKPEPPPARADAEWAREFRDALHACLRRSDWPTVQRAKTLIEEYDASRRAE